MPGPFFPSADRKIGLFRCNNRPLCVGEFSATFFAFPMKGGRRLCEPPIEKVKRNICALCSLRVGYYERKSRGKFAKNCAKACVACERSNIKAVARWAFEWISIVGLIRLSFLMNDRDLCDVFEKFRENSNWRVLMILIYKNCLEIFF